MRAGLRPGAKAPESPPDSKTGAPAPDSTGTTGSHMFIDDSLVVYEVQSMHALITQSSLDIASQFPN